MKTWSLVFFTAILLSTGCVHQSPETILFASYEASVEPSTNAKASFICYSTTQLDELLMAFHFSEGLRRKFKDVDFEKNLVCAITNFRIVDVVGKDNMGFLRIKPEPTNGVGVAIVKREPSRFYQFNKS